MSLFTAIIALIIAVNSQSYMNPVGNCNCPDPGAIFYDGKYYVGTTGSDSNGHFPLRRSNDAINWTQIGYIFTSNNAPAWTLQNGNFWAPEIHQINDNQFNTYFVAQDKTNNNLLSVGVATSSTPYGPFKDTNNKALVPGDSSTGIGNIDPNYFRDPMTNIPYVIYKYDGNSQGKKTPIYMQQLSDDGMSTIGNPVQLITDDKAWECSNNYCVVEAPWMIYNTDTKYYYLFYSATGYASATYNIGVARARNITSPFTKFNGPILHTRWGSPYIEDVDNLWAGPGHCSVLKYNNNDNNQWIILYHSWKADAVNKGSRYLMLDSIQWVDDWPRIFTDTPSQDRTNVEMFTCSGNS